MTFKTFRLLPPVEMTKRGGEMSQGFALPMLVYQLETKLKGGFDFARGNFTGCIRAHAPMMNSLESHRFRAADQFCL